MENKPVKNISDERKMLYYFGMLLMIAGVIVFLTTFFNRPSVSANDFSSFEKKADNTFNTAITGMIILVVGAVLMGIGKKGAAGSGLVLDPEQERKDLEPLNRGIGGQVSDMLDEANIGEHLKNEKTIIKIRCRKCGALNDEQDKFCGQCGDAL